MSPVKKGFAGSDARSPQAGAVFATCNLAAQGPSPQPITTCHLKSLALWTVSPDTIPPYMDLAVTRRPSARNLLITRPGACFTCHADGSCCTSIHLLGPVTKAEMVPVERLRKGSVVWDSTIRGNVFAYKENGTCVFLRDDNLCGVHAKIGVEQKPATCRKFPYSLVSTPDGRRVVTAHRCSCRTMGERAPLDPANVEKEIRIEGEPLRSERSVTGKVPLTARKSVSFESWKGIESALFARLEKQENPWKVLGVKPFPKLAKGRKWADIAEDFQDQFDESAFEVAKAWFGDAILNVTEGEKFPKRERPWARFYDGAEKRSKTKRKPIEMLNDFLADGIWSFDWLGYGSFARGRYELATRLAVADSIGKQLIKQKVRSDRAYAEALLIIELVGITEHWEEVAPLMPNK